MVDLIVVFHIWFYMVVVWRSRSTLVSVNEVNLRLARLVLGWMTMFGFNSRCGTFISVCNRHPDQLSLAIPSWVSAVSTTQRAVTLCSWGVKADMVRVWVRGKIDCSPCYARAISERFRNEGLI